MRSCTCLGGAASPRASISRTRSSFRTFFCFFFSALYLAYTCTQIAHHAHQTDHRMRIQAQAMDQVVPAFSWLCCGYDRGSSW
jgi:hypothetical protein